MSKRDNPGESNDIGNIIAENVIRHIGVHYSRSGLIPTVHAADAVEFIENEIEQFNRAVTPGIERSRIVRLLVDRSITSRLRWMAAHITQASKKGCDTALEELRK